MFWQFLLFAILKTEAYNITNIFIYLFIWIKDILQNTLQNKKTTSASIEAFDCQWFSRLVAICQVCLWKWPTPLLVMKWNESWSGEMSQRTQCPNIVTVLVLHGVTKKGRGGLKGLLRALPLPYCQILKLSLFTYSSIL